jgi:hypothetical protein
MPHDHRLAIGYGSAWHLLRLLGWQRERFNTQIANGLRVQGLDPKSISWLDFPPATEQRTYPSDTPIRDKQDFCGDQHPGDTVRCPADPAGWKPAINAIHKSLGLVGGSELESRVHEVFISVNPAHPGFRND